MSIKVSFFTLLVVSLQCFGKGQMLILGGGGEPVRIEVQQSNLGKVKGQSSSDGVVDNPGTIFDNVLENTGKYSATQTQFDTSIVFDGDGKRDHTKSIIKKYYQADQIKAPRLTEKSFNAQVESLLKSIDEGKIKSGENILIQIMSHGAEKRSYDGEETHRIAMASGTGVSDLQSLSGAETVSLDLLKKVAEKAKEKNIRLGILDFSCHSGSTLSLANENTCVITSTAPDLYGYGGEASFDSVFSKNMKPGKTLEQVYIEAIESRSNDPEFPMISTPIGLSLQEAFYNKVEMFLKYFEKNSLDKLEKKMVFEDHESLCRKLVQDYDELMKILKDLRKATDIALFGEINFLQTRESLEKYLHYQLDLMKSMEAGKKLNDQKPINVCFRKKCSELTEKKLAEIDFDEYIKMEEQYLDFANSESDKRRAMRRLDLALKEYEYFKKMRSSNEHFRKYSEAISEMNKDGGKSYVLAHRASAQLKNLYQGLYKRGAYRDDKPNACSNFTL